MSTTNNVNAGTRIVSMFLDHIIMSMGAMIFSIPIMIRGFYKAFTTLHKPENTNPFSGPLFYVSLIGLAVYFCKDCINGRSPGKRIMKMQVVKNATGEVASPLRCFVRNIFCALWPVEVIVTLASPGRRLGDMIAGTKVVDYDATAQQQEVKINKLLIPLAVSYSLMLLIVLPLQSLRSTLKPIAYIESSYNDSESKALEKLYTDSLGQYVVPSVRVYDKIQDQDLKYISVIYELKENYLEDDSNYKILSEALLNHTYSLFPENTFTGRAQYVFSEPGSMQKRTVHIGKVITKNK